MPLGTFRATPVLPGSPRKRDRFARAANFVLRAVLREVPQIIPPGEQFGELDAAPTRLGNQTSASATGRTISFTSSGMPRDLTSGSTGVTYSYQYDGFNQRAVRTNRLTKDIEIDLGDLLEARFSELSHTYVYRIGTPGRSSVEVAVTEKLGQLQGVQFNYLVRDRLGSGVVEILQGGGRHQVLKRAYDPWGAARSADSLATAVSQPSSGSEEGFTGDLEDPGIGVVSTNHRLLDPQTTRFLSPDELRGTSRSDGLNPYAYALNKPTLFTDRSGLLTRLPFEDAVNADKMNSNPFTSSFGGTGLNSGSMNGSEVGVGSLTDAAVTLLALVEAGSPAAVTTGSSDAPNSSANDASKATVSSGTTGTAGDSIETADGTSGTAGSTGATDTSGNAFADWLSSTPLYQHALGDLRLTSISPALGSMAAIGDVAKTIDPDGSMAGAMAALPVGGMVAGELAVDEELAVVTSEKLDVASTELTAAVEERVASGVRTLFHYTNEEGLKGILDSLELKPSLKAVNPKDAYFGDGQYLTDIAPGTVNGPSLSRALIGNPFQAAKFTHFIEIDVSGLNVVQGQGRPNIYVVPNSAPLDISGRLVNFGSW